MPLVEYSLRTLRPIIQQLKADLAPERPRVLGLSNPDLIIHPATLIKIFRDELPRERPRGDCLRGRSDAEGIIKWHKAQKITDQVIDTQNFFESIGCDFTSVDIVEGRGGEFIHDLNYPWPMTFSRTFPSFFNLVIDIISNQCFNVAQAMANGWDAVTVGGYMLHVIPLNLVNQGFYNVSPTAFYDFYNANGGEILVDSFPVGVYDAPQCATDIDPVRRLRNVPDDTMNLFIVRKVKQQHTRWPIMTKFVRYPDAKK